MLAYVQKKRIIASYSEIFHSNEPLLGLCLTITGDFAMAMPEILTIPTMAF
jgi:hypothetical protein